MASFTVYGLKQIMCTTWEWLLRKSLLIKAAHFVHTVHVKEHKLLLLRELKYGVSQRFPDWGLIES